MREREQEKQHRARRLLVWNLSRLFANYPHYFFIPQARSTSYPIETLYNTLKRHRKEFRGVGVAARNQNHINCPSSKKKNFIAYKLWIQFLSNWCDHSYPPAQHSILCKLAVRSFSFIYLHVLAAYSYAQRLCGVFERVFYWLCEYMKEGRVVKREKKNHMKYIKQNNLIMCYRNLIC